MRRSNLGSVELETYLDGLASAAPTPGGGSAATVVAALGAALLAMVARITLESARLAGVHDAARAVAADADRLRAAFIADRPRDEAAYGAVVAAMALSRATEPERERRTAALQAALTGAAEAPLEVAERCAAAMAVAARAAALENRHLMSDVECAVRFLHAAFEAGAANVRVNHDFLHDPAVVAAQRRRLEEARQTLALDEAAATERFAR
jgi:formiminotetrahydrofolate cyclodeaminase